MIFRNHLPKQHYQNRIDDNMKAIITMQALFYWQTIAKKYLEGDPTGPAVEHWEKEIQICQETMDDLAVVFPVLFTRATMRSIEEATQVELDV